MSDTNLVNGEKWADSSNYTKGREKTITRVTIHHFAGTNFESAGNRFATPNVGASAHYSVGSNGQIHQHVHESDTAWSDANWDSNCQTISVEHCNSTLAPNYEIADSTFETGCQLTADIFKRHNLGKAIRGVNLFCHREVSKTPTSCPGPYLYSKMDNYCARVNEILGYKDDNTINNTENKKNIDEVAREVIAGKWGVGEDRKNKLQNAGYNASIIQNKVNELLGVRTAQPSKSTLKSIDVVAQEVINGTWGNGEDRKNRLKNAGYDVGQIQAKVNQILTGKSSTSNLKNIDEIAKEVIAGKWGNGQDRKDRLTRAGYNAEQVQAKVNQMF